MPVLPAQAGADTNVGSQQVDRAGDQVAEIDLPTGLELLLVPAVDAGNLERLFGAEDLLFRLSAFAHAPRELCVSLGADVFVFGARDGADDVAQVQGWVIQVLVIVELQLRQALLKQPERSERVDHLGAGWQPQARAVLPQQFEAERVEGAHPDARGRVRRNQRYPPPHLFGGLVRECERQDRAGQDALLEQMENASNERACLAGAWPRLEQERTVSNPPGHVLARVESALRQLRTLVGVDFICQFGREQCAAELGDNQTVGQAGLHRDCARVVVVGSIPMAQDRRWQQELACEYVSLALAPLSGTVTLHSSDPGLRRLFASLDVQRRGIAHEHVVRVQVAQVQVAQLVSLIEAREARFYRLVEPDRSGITIEHGLSSVQEWVIRRHAHPDEFHPFDRSVK